MGIGGWGLGAGEEKFGLNPSSRPHSDMSPWQERNLAAITRRLAPLRHCPQGVLFAQRSAYNHVVVRRRQEQLLLCYRHPRSHVEEVQSRLDPLSPLDLLSPYTQAMLLALMWCPQPRRMLFIGLGGGRLQMVLHHVFESAQLETVELDPLVLDLATRFFGFFPDERQRAVIAEGRSHIRALAAGTTYDLIMLDAYRAEGVAPHLLTSDFYAECRARLGPHGLVVSNLHASTPVYDAARRTFAAAFRYTTACSVPSGNVIVTGSDTLAPDPGILRNQAALAERSRASGLPLTTWAKQVSLRTLYRRRAAILRDHEPSG